MALRPPPMGVPVNKTSRNRRIQKTPVETITGIFTLESEPMSMMKPKRQNSERALRNAVSSIQTAPLNDKPSRRYRTQDSFSCDWAFEEPRACNTEAVKKAR